MTKKIVIKITLVENLTDTSIKVGTKVGKNVRPGIHELLGVLELAKTNIYTGKVKTNDESI